MTAPEQMLKPCPCGAVPKHGYQGDVLDEEGYGFVECHENGISVVIHAATEAEAIAAWNTRPATDELVEALEKIEAFAAPGQEMSLAVAIDALCDCWNVARTALRNTGAVS